MAPARPVRARAIAPSHPNTCGCHHGGRHRTPVIAASPPEHRRCPSHPSRTSKSTAHQILSGSLWGSLVPKSAFASIHGPPARAERSTATGRPDPRHHYGIPRGRASAPSGPGVRQVVFAVSGRSRGGSLLRRGAPDPNGSRVRQIVFAAIYFHLPRRCLGPCWAQGPASTPRQQKEVELKIIGPPLQQRKLAMKRICPPPNKGKAK